MNTPTNAVAASARHTGIQGLSLLTALGFWMLLLAAGRGHAATDSVPSGMVAIPDGFYRPLFRMPNEPERIRVPGFLLETNLVTNEDFRRFVVANPRWRRSAVRPIFADAQYLAQWAGDLDYGGDAATVGRRPVTRISWFAARAYAAWRGRRLPSTAEWELAAAAGFNTTNGAAEPEYGAMLVRWYSTPMDSQLRPVAAQRPNHYGIHDLHGLVWEWTEDFNSEMVTGDARGDTGIERQLFCGSGSFGAQDRSDYPSFIRRAFRSSLRGDYALAPLGFRCALTLPVAAQGQGVRVTDGRNEKP